MAIERTEDIPLIKDRLRVLAERTKVSWLVPKRKGKAPVPSTAEEAVSTFRFCWRKMTPMKETMLIQIGDPASTEKDFRRLE